MLDIILEYLHGCPGQQLLERIVREAANKSGHRISNEAELTESSAARSRDRVQVLKEVWWPEHKGLITSFIERSAGEGDDRLLVEKLRQQLLESVSKATAIVVIVGMGGIGKTSTAKWYANVYEEEYDHIIWINSGGSALKYLMTTLGGELGLVEDKSKKFADFVRAIYGRFKQARCLFIFDNAGKYVGENGLSDLLPKNALHHSIITSRHHDWGNVTEWGTEPLELGVFTGEECVRLLSSTLDSVGKGGTTEEMLEFGKEIGFLPLALQSAVATIRKPKSVYTLKSYLERIQKDQKILMKPTKKILQEYELSIGMTLRLSIEQIKEDEYVEEECRELIETILHVSAYCEPNYISESLFLGLPGIKQYVITDAIELLLRYSLVSEETTRGQEKGRSFGIHRLLQYVIRHEILTNPKDGLPVIKLAFDCILKNPPKFREHANHAMTLAMEQFGEDLLTFPNFPSRLVVGPGSIIQTASSRVIIVTSQKQPNETSDRQKCTIIRVNTCAVFGHILGSCPITIYEVENSNFLGLTIVPPITLLGSNSFTDGVFSPGGIIHVGTQR